MTTFWPKRDEDGRHVNTGAEHGGPIANFKPSCEPDHIETLKPLSELLAKLDPDIVERAMVDVDNELKCAKCDDTGLSENALRRMDGQTRKVLCPCECTE